MTLLAYILRQLLTGVVFSVGGMVFVALPGIAVNAVHKLGGVGLEPLVDYLPMVLADLVPYILPIGFLLAVVATYGRLAADNEWTAICMAGFSPWRMLLPALAVASALGLAVFWLVSNVTPVLDSRLREFRKDTLLQMMRTLSPGRTELRFPGTGGYINARYRDGDVLRDVILDLPGREGEEARTFVLAEQAEIVLSETELRLVLDGAKRLDAAQDLFLGHVEIVRDLSTLVPERGQRRLWKYMTSAELAEALARGEIPAKERGRASFELHRRRAIGATALLFLLLGAPTGLLMRRGTGLGALAIAVGYALLYYLLSMRLGKWLASTGAVPDWLAAWSTTLAGAAAGGWLLWRVLRR